MPPVNYDKYNREERYLCAHLFRLLHEPHNDHQALREFLGRARVDAAPRVYCEVALIRDAYHERRGHPNEFMDALVREIAQQEGVTEYRVYSQLEPRELCTPHLTHPGQIRRKAGEALGPQEGVVYGALQGMFNAKPDLLVCIESELIVYEAKLTMGFDEEQLVRTRCIADVWAKLLHRDLGFEAPPTVSVRKLGLAKFGADVTWERVSEIATAVYADAHDRTRSAIACALAMAG